MGYTYLGLNSLYGLTWWEINSLVSAASSRKLSAETNEPGMSPDFRSGAINRFMDTGSKKAN